MLKNFGKKMGLIPKTQEDKAKELAEVFSASMQADFSKSICPREVSNFMTCWNKLVDENQIDILLNLVRKNLEAFLSKKRFYGPLEYLVNKNNPQVGLRLSQIVLSRQGTFQLYKGTKNLLLIAGILGNEQKLSRNTGQQQPPAESKTHRPAPKIIRFHGAVRPGSASASGLSSQFSSLGLSLHQRPPVVRLVEKSKQQLCIGFSALMGGHTEPNAGDIATFMQIWKQGNLDGKLAFLLERPVYLLPSSEKAPEIWPTRLETVLDNNSGHYTQLIDALRNDSPLLTALMASDKLDASKKHQIITVIDAATPGEVGVPGAIGPARQAQIAAAEQKQMPDPRQAAGQRP